MALRATNAFSRPFFLLWQTSTDLLRIGELAFVWLLGQIRLREPADCRKE